MSILQFPTTEAPDIRGPERSGCSVIIENRCIPNLHMHERSETIEFVLDGRFAYEFPKECALLAASFAAQAMAIGAGYPHLGAASKEQPFAPECVQIDLG